MNVLRILKAILSILILLAAPSADINQPDLGAMIRASSERDV